MIYSLVQDHLSTLAAIYRFMHYIDLRTKVVELSVTVFLDHESFKRSLYFKQS